MISPLFVGLAARRPGVFCIWLVVLAAGSRAGSSARVGLLVELRDQLAQAGLLVSDAAKLVAGAVVLGPSSVFVMSSPLTRGRCRSRCASALMAAYAPIALVRMRARNRRAMLRDLWPDVVDNIASGGARRARAARGAEPARGRAVRRSCGRPSPPSPRTTGRPGASRSASTGSRSGSATLSPTGSSSPCASPARSAAATSGGCCARCRPSCARTRARGPSWRPGRGGRSTRPGWRWPRRGSCWRCCAPGRTRSQAYSRPAGIAVLAWRWRAVASVAYRVMVHVGRLPEEERVLR